MTALFALLLALAGGMSTATEPAAAASPTEVESQKFVGEGSSSFGFALYYARSVARSQADAAGFPNCTEIYVEEWYAYARVVWECTR